MKNLYYSSTIGMIVSAFVLAGVCTAAEEGKVLPNGTLTAGFAVLGNEQLLITLVDNNATFIVGNVCESLVTLDTKGQVKPMLADKWEMSPDGMTYTFYLHKGVQFQGGWGELTAEDVKYTVERVINEKTSPNPQAAPLRARVASIQVVDPYKIVFNLKAPAWDLLSLINHMDPVPGASITSKKYVESVGDAKAAQQPIGTGPWRLVEVQKGSHYRYEAVENHWRQTPRFKNLVLKIIPEEATRLSMIKTGELDIAAISLGSKKEAERQGIKLRSSRGVGQMSLQLGGILAPRYQGFDSSVPWVPIPGDAKASERALKVRQALALAIDKEQIAKEIYYGEAALTSVTLFDPGAPSTDPSWKPYPFDPKQARKLLTEAGYPNGFDKPIEMWLVAKLGGEELPDVGQSVGMMWEKNLGLKINYVTMDYGVFRPQAAARKWKNPMFVRADAVSATSEPASFYQVIAYKEGGLCLLFETDATDQLITQIRAEMDSKKRVELHRKLGQYIYENYLTIPMGLKNGLYTVSDRVGDWPLVPGRISSANLVFEEVTPAK